MNGSGRRIAQFAQPQAMLPSHRQPPAGRLQTAPSFLDFWGKARPIPTAAHAWHPIAYHMLDVASVLDAILDARPLALSRGAKLLGVEPPEARRLLVSLAALHDIGKFAPAFQKKALDHWPSALGGVDPLSIPETHHTTAGYGLWCHVLSDRLADRLWEGGSFTLHQLAPGVFGHHGRPMSDADARASIGSVFPGASRSEAVACAEAIVECLMSEPLATPVPRDDQIRLASWWVAGLMTVSDWVGSNQTWFPYEAPQHGLAEYWNMGKERAARAVRQAGLCPSRPTPARSFTELTGFQEPSPTQAWAESARLPDGPVLVVIEDATGAGKTEAAQMLVHRLMAQGRASGAYWAMPTQATANAMYLRQRSLVHALFDATSNDRPPSVVLAHGQAHLHEGYQETILRDGDSSRDSDSNARSDDDMPAEVACEAFIADDSRAALLADVGSGTVDQALLGTLPSRFNTVRLFGLSEKVIVFDEAHAYDAYMGVEVQSLLRFQAALGGSAIILSATLPHERREELVGAWLDGLNRGLRRGSSSAQSTLLREDAYPLATVVGEGVVQEYALVADDKASRSVQVRFAGTFDDALEHVLTSARTGRAVAWIRNTVDDCLAAARAIREAGAQTKVFHARFAQGDRQAREAEVTTQFDKNSTAEDRRGAIVVATQVIEQSLDLDFDVMVTDLAPVDLLIQRAGRLQRHERPDRGVLPLELVILAPPAVEEPDRDWLTPELRGTGAVYRNTGILWRTVMELDRAGYIRSPSGLRPLIEAVYSSDDVPVGLVDTTSKAEAADMASAATANHVTLDPPDGYIGGGTGWFDIRPLTRLGDEQTTVRLARLGSDGYLRPWRQDEGSARRAWALSEVKLAAHRVPFGSSSLPLHQDKVEAIRAGWGRFERDIPVLVLEPEVGDDGRTEWVGGFVRPNGELCRVRYSTEEGCVFAG